MARTNMNELLRKRMAATQQASEQQTGDAAYERIFQMPVQRTEAVTNINAATIVFTIAAVNEKEAA